MNIIIRHKVGFIMFLFFMITTKALGENSFTENSFIYKINPNKVGVSLIGYEHLSMFKGNDTLHIASSVSHEGKSFPVKHIGEKALAGLNTVKFIVIDEGIESIGNYSFERCLNLEGIYLPSSVEGIGLGILGSCHNLTTVVVDSKNEVFDSRDNCNAIIITEENELLSGCSSTKIPSSVKTIGESAFYHCGTMEQITIPEGVEKIGRCAFWGCSMLKWVSLPESLREIEGDAFCGCNSIESIIIPRNVNKIGEVNIFRGCESLSSITVDETNKTYHSWANSNAIVRETDSALVATCKKTVVTENIRKLAPYCFAGTCIRNIRLPRSVVVISDDAFDGCYGIDSLSVDKNNPLFKSPLGTNAIMTKDGKKLVLGCGATKIPNGTESIGNKAFMGRYSKLVLKVPDGLKTIGNEAFSNNNYISEIVLPLSVNKIGHSAFSYCHNLKAVQIPKIDVIESFTFANCANLSVVNISEGVKKIGDRAFEGCFKLKDIHLPASIEIIDHSAFKDCPFPN